MHNGSACMPTQADRVLVRVLLAGATLLCMSTPAWSQQGGFARPGGYAAVSAMPKFTFDATTFDGESAYVEVDKGTNEFVILPKLEEDMLLRFALGYRWPSAALEVSYDRTQQGGIFMGVPVDTTFQAVNVDARAFLLSGSPVQPYGLFGGSLPWFRVKDGSQLNNQNADARFRGWGLNLEGGVAVYPHPRVGIMAGYAYRPIWFDRASGVTDKVYELRPRFRETVKGITITGMVTF